MTQGNGIVTTKTYNNRYQLSSLNIGTLKQLSYTRDYVGNITAITDNINPTNNKSYTYDSLYRLILSTGQWGALTYAYDSIGNRTYETTDTGNTTYTYSTNTNKLASVFGEKNLSFSYDNNGNTITENTKQYIYNQNQRLIKTMDGSNVLGEYIYNSNGQRTDKRISSQNKCTVFHYDQNGLLITESTRTGNIKAEYVYLNGSPLVKIENNNIYYYHNDHLGTPIIMTNESGQNVWTGEYLPFGEPLSVTGSITNNLRFPGQYYDSETALNYNWFRYYDSKTGRYPQADPIGLLGGVNLFTYVGNSPCNRIDPWGLKIIYNNYKISDYRIHLALISLDNALPNSDIIVTGGDRYIDNDGKIRSSSNNQLIPHSAPNSTHLYGIAVDFKISNMTPTKEFISNYFDYVKNDYPDNHIHGDIRKQAGYGMQLML